MRTGFLWLGCALAAGCVTETIQTGGLIMPGTPVAAGDEDTTEVKTAHVREWLQDLAMEGVKPESQAARTIFLIKRLIEHFPISTEVILAEGVGSESEKVRENSAFVLCYAQDARAEQALIALLDDPVEAVRLSAAASLVTGYRNSAGVPPLLRALYHTELHYRREAVKNLRIYTQMYFNYDPAGPRSEREFYASKWQDWWRRNRDTFVPPVRGPGPF